MLILLKIYLIVTLLTSLLMLFAIANREYYLEQLEVEDPEKAERHRELLENRQFILIFILPFLWPFAVISSLFKR